MSYFKSLIITRKGEELLANVNSNINETITFTRAEIGSGSISSDLEIKSLLALKEKFLDLKIIDIKKNISDNKIVRIETQFSNSSLKEEKQWKEFGLYAKGSSTEEILFAYTNAGEKFDVIPVPKDNPQSFVIGVNLTMTSDIKIEAIIDLSSFVSVGKFNEELNKKLDKSTVTSEYDNAAKIESKIKEAKEKADEALAEANKKLNSGLVSEEYNTGKKIEDKIKDLEQRFKNFCPYAVGDIYITTKTENPSTVWLGTTWSKIEGRFLLGTSNSQAAKLTGGSMNKNISQANLPNVKLTVNSFSVTMSAHSHGYARYVGYAWGDANAEVTQDGNGPQAHYRNFNTNSAGGGSSSTASPQTSALGSGQALDITPAYYTTHMWLRIS